MAASQNDFDAPEETRAAVLRSHFALAVTDVLDGEERPSALPVTPDFARHLSSLAYSWTTEALSPDLEAFARHSKRATVGIEDVALAARKNAGTRALIEAEAVRQKAAAKKGGKS